MARVLSLIDSDELRLTQMDKCKLVVILWCESKQPIQLPLRQGYDVIHWEISQGCTDSVKSWSLYTLLPLKPSALISLNHKILIHSFSWICLARATADVYVKSLRIKGDPKRLDLYLINLIMLMNCARSMGTNIGWRWLPYQAAETLKTRRSLSGFFTYWWHPKKVNFLSG